MSRAFAFVLAVAALTAHAGAAPEYRVILDRPTIGGAVRVREIEVVMSDFSPEDYRLQDTDPAVNAQLARAFARQLRREFERRFVVEVPVEGDRAEARLELHVRPIDFTRAPHRARAGAAAVVSSIVQVHFDLVRAAWRSPGLPVMVIASRDPTRPTFDSLSLTGVDRDLPEEPVGAGIWLLETLTETSAACGRALALASEPPP